MIPADHRTDERCLIERIADADAARALGEPGREIRIDRSLHQDARTGGAALTVVREDHEEGGIQRAGQIGVLEHYEGALAPELHAELLESRALDDAIAGHGRAGKGDRTHVRVLAQGLTRALPVAVDDIQDAGGNPGFERQLSQPRCRER